MVLFNHGVFVCFARTNGLQGLLFSILWKLFADLYVSLFFSVVFIKHSRLVLKVIGLIVDFCCCCNGRIAGKGK